VYDSEEHAYRVVPVVSGLENPWGVAFLPRGGMLITERPGRLRLVRDGQLMPDPIAGVPEVWARGQGGLLDVALHPDYTANQLVYVSYSKPGAQGATTAIVRGRFTGDALGDVEEIIEANAWSGQGQHFGSRIVFRDGYLFFSVGDRGDMENGQDPSDHTGNIIRVHDDGRVPEDNPFVGRAGFAPELYTYGNRNPQGVAVHPTTGEIWAVEHGPRGGDELNLIEAGKNYGWPAITYGINYSGTPITDRTEMEGMEQPVTYWVPSIATSGLAIYSGSAFPEWEGNAFVGALAGQHLRRVVLDGHRAVHQESLLTALGRRIRDVRVGPDGNLYVLTDEANGQLLRIEPRN
jgi:glucose/arabinose dehydrogenase